VRATSALTRLAAWINSDDLARMPPLRFERVKQHIVDTLGAAIGGSRLGAGAATNRFTSAVGDPIASRIISACANARSTEIDDIHLTSCTTPGSVIVPTTLALASAGRLRTVSDFCAATLAGYEALIRFGVALDGPTALHRGIWPTHAAAALGSAAAASRAYMLNPEETVSALATALAFGSGRPVPASQPLSSRWVTLGIAAANGELAARAACEGLRAVEPQDAVSQQLARDLPRRHLFDDIAMKPFATARQGLAAIEAARELVERNSIEAADIDNITVALPEMLRRIVDRPATPATRFESIVSVQYQIALAIVAPDRLVDIDRTPPFSSKALRRLQARVDVRRARNLEADYPAAWPARVTVVVGHRRFVGVMMRPPGDAADPLSWDAIAAKFERLTVPTIGVEVAPRTVRAIQHAHPNDVMPPLWELTS
jgi:2-methylcitrate dehydratase PrpD